ncbi:hypothetical protein [Demequina aurantiaca]|uniref:hypothetical protein n=1 Tax=Demequina aurantiaca TaxID=676200 RepID=UPI003D34FAB2
MTEQTAPGVGSAEQIVTPSGAADRRQARTRAVVLWGVAILVFAVAGAWILGGLNPSLASSGISWQDPAFVEEPADSAFDDEESTFTVWDLDTGAKTSVVVQNDRPYPITVSPGPASPATQVEIAAMDSPPSGLISPDLLTTSAQLDVPAGGYIVVIMQVTDRCMQMMAGSAAGNDVAIVEVTTFGITRSLEVQFPATYMAGTTSGHGADPACSPAFSD